MIILSFVIGGMMRGVKKSNRFGILLLAAMTIPFWIVALVLWFTLYTTHDKKDSVKNEAEKNITDADSIKK
jgi:hypothetical protein